MIPPQLRPDQAEVESNLGIAYRNGFRCPLVRAETGWGKTFLFSNVARKASDRGHPVLIAAHRKEIIRQISLSLAKFGVKHRIIAPADKVRQIKLAHFRAFERSYVDEHSAVMVGSVQTIVTRFDVIDRVLARIPDKKLLIVMDEGHHCIQDTQWGAVMDRYYVEGSAFGLIVTATPERLDGRGLGAGQGGYADAIIKAPPMLWLIERGFLSPYEFFVPANTIDVSNVKHVGGDFVASEIERLMNKPTITGDAIEHWRKHANGMRTIVFCRTVNHSKAVAQAFNDAGIPAAHIDGKIDDSERDQAIAEFADGRITVLTNVNLVSEGFDLGSIAQKPVTIDCMIDLAPTESLVLVMQRWGRVLRPAPGKIAVILDHAGNYKRHGLPDDEREWTLDGRKKQQRAEQTGEEVDSLYRFMCCGKIGKHWLAVCPHCGTVQPEKKKRETKIEVEEGNLVKITAEQIEAARRHKRALQGQAKDVEQLVALGMGRARAVKIVQARQEKQALIGEIVDRLSVMCESGVGAYSTFGTTIGAVRKMRPRELKELRAKIDAFTTTKAA